MSDENQLEEIRGELEELNSNNVHRRSFFNPMYWVGLSFYLGGFLLCLTIIGIPLGVAMMRGGRSWMYKNLDKNKGL